jgi:hypothetical protein
MKSSETNRITEYGWQLVERLNEDGTMIYFLNLRNARGWQTGSIMLNLKQLQKLKHFMEERKFE